MAGGGPTVTLVIVTFNRLEHLKALLDRIVETTRLPDHIVVVDNAGTDGTAEFLRGLRRSDHPIAPLVDVVQSPDNDGFAAGLNRGLRIAAEGGATYAWLSDDDSRPAPDFLERQLAVAAGITGLGVLGDRGKVVRWGVARDLDVLAPEHLQRRRIGPDLYRCDWTLVDGALVDVAAAVAVGLLRDDFFMMCEDMEFTARIRRTGWVVAAARSTDTERLHLGSTGPSRPWRAYYQTRNELLTARSQRSPRAVAGWTVRTSKLLVAAAVSRRGAVIRMRALGAWHGIRGVAGRTIDPVQAS